MLLYLLNRIHITVIRTVQQRLKIGMWCSQRSWKRAAANPSAVKRMQWLWLESCCWCSEDQEMTFGKTLQWHVFLWRTDRRPCQQPLEAVPFPSKNVDNGCPLWCLSITLSKHWVAEWTNSSEVCACKETFKFNYQWIWYEHSCLYFWLRCYCTTVAR